MDAARVLQQTLAGMRGTGRLVPRGVIRTKETIRPSDRADRSFLQAVIAARERG